jgi:hypothetical protein
MQAFARNCRNQALDVKGDAQAVKSREARVPKLRSGTDRPVGATKVL